MNNQIGKDSERGDKSTLRGLFSQIIGMFRKIISRYFLYISIAIGYLIVFAWIFSNALWFQKGMHPSPIFVTRNPISHRIILGMKNNPINTSQEKVVTFNVEKLADDYDAISLTRQSFSEKDIALLKEIQNKLKQHGLYEGLPDGKLNNHTIEAILSFQKKIGIPSDGVPSDLLLDLLQKSERQHIVSREKLFKRSSPISSNLKSSSNDSIANLIKKSEKREFDDISKKSQDHNSIDTNLVKKIQKGLRNMDYNNVNIDGIIDEKTRKAVRNFELRYHLPETSNPSQRVLRKLEQIGAL
ncbi:peptidoglycan-binding protein [Candidatus Liberibacter sp.]|uniref:peptidoglycan-binding domain-containing protein n=1 Tax=Candidatus Liberibacter sp. TaxID=34022 RepID=UPI0015F4F9B9|nr:peptidoglycan-binding domain-containing protein [Candidatus Liberibacter sp.]MBA5723871.1 peptidoglycan-binding protein [Candidatus Liberibacter sp.]